ncbi:MAG: gamma carbonic anhydrase family protein [Syntrophobacterales bacterium]|nr:gamma carbonic anhydrase family protein [Syntrophobacterales bacterium]
MPVYEFDGKIPRISAAAFVHPEAVIIGDVVVGESCFIGPGAVLRGDLGPITLGEGVSFQDNAVIHVDIGSEVVIENDVIVGHGALLHDVHILPRTIIGMGAVLMFHVICEEDSFVAAGSVVLQGMRVPAGTIVGGNPAKIIKKASAKNIIATAEGVILYRELAEKYRKTMKKLA